MGHREGQHAMTRNERAALAAANKRLKAGQAAVEKRRQVQREREKQQTISFSPETLELAAKREPQIAEQVKGRTEAPQGKAAHSKAVPLEGHTNGIMPQTMADVHDVTKVEVSTDLRHLPLGLLEDRPHDSGYLPGLSPPSEDPLVRSLPLILFDAGGGASLTQGNGAPVPLRLFVDVMLCLPSEIRRSDGPNRVFATLRQLRDTIWPNGWQRGRDYPKLVRAMNYLTVSGVPWRGGVWRPITVRNVPVDLDDEAIFEVELPPGSGRGPLVNRPAAHQLGLISAPAFRLYLNLTGYWDRFGTFNGRLIGPTTRAVRRDQAGYLLDTRGRVITEKGKPTRRASHPRAIEQVAADGRSIRQRNPAVTKYPPITPDQLARMAYADHDLRNGMRRMRQEARDKALVKVLEVTGAAVEVVIDHQEGRRDTIRVLPSEKHKVAHDTMRQFSEVH